MPLTKQQSEQIKKQLIQQVEKLPQENKEQIKQGILTMSEEQLEQFLKQNQIQISETGKPTSSESKCVFCSIIKNETPSYKIAENRKAIAILEINPLSKGHSIILPLEHTSIEKLPKPAMTLAQKIAKKIKTKLKPDDIKIETSDFQGHSIVNIVPIYKDVPLEKKRADEKELRQLQSKLETKKRASRVSEKKPKSKPSKNLPEIPFRIP